MNFQPVYDGGYPTRETAAAMFDEFDYQAATQFYVWAYPYLNGLGVEQGFAAMGGDERSVYIFDKGMQPQHVVMTANDEVIYGATRLVDVGSGPVVFEVPPRSRGHFFDFAFRGYGDTGDGGPDQGEGGKYLLTSAGYEGDVPAGYFPVRIEHSNLAMYWTRTFPEAEGSQEAAVELGKRLRWYPLAEADDPTPNEVVLIGDRPCCQDWPKNEEAFAWLAQAFNRDKVPPCGQTHLGNMRRLGIEVGKPFSPDNRAREILKKAAATGQAMVLSMAFRGRQNRLLYEDRQYELPVLHDPDFVTDVYEQVEIRAGAWHQVVGNFATFVAAESETGQFPMLAYRDSSGENLNGSNTYRLRVPPDPPTAQFWQIPVYEVKTRSLISTDQRRPTRSSLDDLIENDDGSVDIYFSPNPPEGYERNWIKTIPGEGWFTLPRLYAPLEPVLNREWRLDDIERIGVARSRAASLHDNLQSANEDLQMRVAGQVQQLERAKQLKRYVSPQIADSILTGRREMRPMSKRRNLTIFFSDVRGFTPLSERLEPEELVDRLNEYLSEMAELVFKHGGTLDKYVGDAIMVFFGDPEPQEDHAQRAVRMALEMRDRVSELQQSWSLRKEEPLTIGMGIATGYVTVGDIGSSARTDYTVLGNHVNLASRLADRAKAGEILVSERTMVANQSVVHGREVDRLELEGVRRPVRIYRVERQR